MADSCLFSSQVKELDDTGSRLSMTHPDQAQSIYDHQKEINEKWTGLTEKADQRKAKLLDSYDFQRFLSDFRYDLSLDLVKCWHCGIVLALVFDRLS